MDKEVKGLPRTWRLTQYCDPDGIPLLWNSLAMRCKYRGNTLEEVLKEHEGYLPACSAAMNELADSEFVELKDASCVWHPFALPGRQSSRKKNSVIVSKTN